MSAHIRHHKAVLPILEIDEIEIVAAYDLGRAAEGSDVHSADKGDFPGQQTALDDLRKFQFIFQLTKFLV